MGFTAQFAPRQIEGTHVSVGLFSLRSGNENGASDTRGDFAESELYKLKLLIAIE